MKRIVNQVKHPASRRLLPALAFLGRMDERMVRALSDDPAAGEAYQELRALDWTDMVGGFGSPDGLYHDDTRFLSQLELRLNGDQPLLLSANPGEDNALLTVDLANPDTTAAVREQEPDPGGVPRTS